MLNWLKRILPRSGVTMEMASGVGTLSCARCDHTEQVHLFTHGFGPTSNCTMGVQCQSCAKFVSFDSEPVGESSLPALKALIEVTRCDCGGSFARDKPMMCPHCKSRKVKYDVEMLT